MKNMSIWQRLNTALFLLVLLLMIGCGLALSIEVAVTKAERRAQQLANTQDRISLDLLLMSDSIRGLLLDPKNDADRKHRPETEKALKPNFDYITDTYRYQPALLKAVENLTDYVHYTLLPHHQKVMDLAESDAPAALLEYNKLNPGLRKQREDLLTDLAKQIEIVQTEESAQAWTTTKVLSAGIAVIFIASLVVGRFQSSAVT